MKSSQGRLPFTYLLRILAKYLFMESTKKLNLFTNKHGVSKYFSPRMIMRQENLDYKLYWKYQIREYVQAQDESQHKNTNSPRSLDCVYLRPIENNQDGHEWLHLQTNKLVKCQNLTKNRSRQVLSNKCTHLQPWTTFRRD